MLQTDDVHVAIKALESYGYKYDAVLVNPGGWCLCEEGQTETPDLIPAHAPFMKCITDMHSHVIALELYTISYIHIQ